LVRFWQCLVQLRVPFVHFSIIKATMAEDDDDVCVAVGEGPPSDSDEVMIASPAAPGGSEGGASRPRGRRWIYPSEGTRVSWMLVDASLPSQARHGQVRADDRFSSITPDTVGCVGALRCKWKVCNYSEESLAGHEAVMGTSCSSRKPPLGYVTYEALDYFALDDFVLLLGAQRSKWAEVLPGACGELVLDADLGTAAEAVRAGVLTTKITLSVCEASSLLVGFPVLRGIPVTAQLRYGSLVDGFPLRWVLKHWWNHWCAERRDREAAVGDAGVPPPPTATHPFLRIPGKRRFLPSREKLKKPTGHSRYDPMKLFSAVDFAHYLRNEENFSRALASSRRCDRDPSDEEYEERSSAQDPSTATRQRARHRADLVFMLLERREVEGWLEDDMIESIQVYTDASPAIGVELQGQLLDFCLRGSTVIRRTLPGSEMAYGLTDATSKGVTLLWGLFLTCGPDKEQLRKIISHISAITTDNGVEVNLLRLPDVLDVFYLWMNGAELRDLQDKVVPGSRLFSNAVRIIGCGHTFGGILCGLCNSLPAWDTLNVQLRSLVHLLATFRIGNTCNGSSAAIVMYRCWPILGRPSSNGGTRLWRWR
jgi:hypothetical protein